MSLENFFNEQNVSSKVKSAIVTKYFKAWANMMKSSMTRAGKMAYVDLFAGPGKYEDGTVSIPIKILQTAIADDVLSQSLVTIFNDKDKEYVNNLKKNINSIPSINKLWYKPVVLNEVIGSEMARQFEQIKFIPTLFLIDSWGYKEISLRFINSVLKDWGCDCIFFFNYNRVSMGLNNKNLKEHINALFGKVNANSLRYKVDKITDPFEKELTIVEAFIDSMQKLGIKYVLPFSFKNETGTKTKHHIFFASKNVKGYEIMKEIMAGESSSKEQCGLTFEYCHASRKYPRLYELNRPLDDLNVMLCENFTGQSLTLSEIYNKHHVGKRYVKANYEEALKQLEKENKIIIKQPVNNTMDDNLVIRFI